MRSHPVLGNSHGAFDFFPTHFDRGQSINQTLADAVLIEFLKVNAPTAPKLDVRCTGHIHSPCNLVAER
jgi:hypothetical protein